MTTPRGATPTASCCRPSRTRSASAMRPRFAQSTQKPVDLIDGEWTSWYGARASSGLRALAAFRVGRGVG